LLLRFSSSQWQFAFSFFGVRWSTNPTALDRHRYVPLHDPRPALVDAVGRSGLRLVRDHRWHSRFDGVTVLPEYVTSKIHAGEKLELRVLPDGQIEAKVVPDR
jgi:hypothetical protein